MCETDKQTCLNAINLTCVAYLSILKFWTQGTGQRSWNSGILKNNNNNKIKVSDDREKSNRYYLSVLTITHKSYWYLWPNINFKKQYFIISINIIKRLKVYWLFNKSMSVFLLKNYINFRK